MPWCLLSDAPCHYLFIYLGKSISENNEFRTNSGFYCTGISDYYGSFYFSVQKVAEIIPAPTDELGEYFA
jgi:hypothetical protein